MSSPESRAPGDEHGPFPRVEEANVLLVFDVAKASDSAVLHIENVEVL